MVIMMLQEKGLLQYDDSVSKYLNIPYTGITIRHLLTHTSGLPDYQAIMDRYWDKTKVAGNEDIIAYLNKYAPPALFTPGQKYAYSNTGYVLLASIAEKASGKDFTAFTRKKIFRRAGMKHADIRTPAAKAGIDNFAVGHMYVPLQSRYVRADSFPSSNYTIWLGNREGPGRISATARDLMQWDKALYTNKLVHQNTIAQAYTPMRLTNGTYSYYGFGWDIDKKTTAGKVVSHNGDNPGYKTQIIRYIDQRITVILLCNNAHRSFEKIVQTLQHIITR
jgi:CubicO group peptidase (beta-lactamase class C family)